MYSHNYVLVTVIVFGRRATKQSLPAIAHVASFIASTNVILHSKHLQRLASPELCMSDAFQEHLPHIKARTELWHWYIVFS